MCLSLVFSLLFLGRLSSGELYLEPSDKLTAEDDYDALPYPRGSGQHFAYWEVNGIVNSTGRSYTAHIASLSGGLPDSFSYRLPPQGCCHLSKTSTTAQIYNCTYATNAGFFNTASGCCIGNLITNSSVIQLPATARANFGLTASSHVMGYMTNDTLTKLGFTELASGAGWIVRRGKSYVNESVKEEEINESFVTLKAPRTVIAAYSNGSLYLVQVDGIEHEKIGLDLYEMAEVLVAMGLYQAVNLDGGGSSVSVYKGSVISKPTCFDTSFICERRVTSITCMQSL